jgi:hypothetical protein
MNNIRNAKIITGRSGKMKNEFEKWMVNPSFTPLVDKFNEFDNRGSFLVKIKVNG